MNNIEKKRQSIQGFLNDLWDACASGSSFELVKTQKKHRTSNEYCAYIMRHVVRKLPEPYRFSVNPDWNKEWVANKLSALTIDAMKKVLEAAANGADPKSLIKHINSGDIVKSPYRFETVGVVEKETKEEVDRTIKVGHKLQESEVKVIKDIIEKEEGFPSELNRDVVITMSLTRTINSVHRDSITFEVSPNVPYEELKNHILLQYQKK